MLNVSNSARLAALLLAGPASLAADVTAQDRAGFDRRGRKLVQLKNGAWQSIPE